MCVYVCTYVHMYVHTCTSPNIELLRLYWTLAKTKNKCNSASKRGKNWVGRLALFSENNWVGGYYLPLERQRFKLIWSAVVQRG